MAPTILKEGDSNSLLGFAGPASLMLENVKYQMKEAAD
jgi:hypothetical protein